MAPAAEVAIVAAITSVRVPANGSRMLADPVLGVRHFDSVAVIAEARPLRLRVADIAARWISVILPRMDLNPVCGVRLRRKVALFFGDRPMTRGTRCAPLRHPARGATCDNNAHKPDIYKPDAPVKERKRYRQAE